MRSATDITTIRAALLRAEKYLVNIQQRGPSAAMRTAAWLDAEVLLSSIIKKDRTWLATHADKTLTAKQIRDYDYLVSRRRRYEPVAYIVGTKEFYGRAFHVTRDVLIPRPETELIVDLLKERFDQNAALTIHDVGTGSGALAVTLAAQFPCARVVASDVSAKAIAIARKNARTHGVLRRISFRHEDVRSHDSRRTTYDSRRIVLANLPYLPIGERARMPRDVTRYEPASALFAGRDGMTLNNRLLRDLSLQPPSLILLEFHPPQARALTAYARRLFPRAAVTVHQDLAKWKRILEVA
jgi:release factor glutamine methyltransferase